MKALWIPCAVALACTAALAKLPPPDDATKAKAAEAAAKAAWQGKVDAYKLCSAQDKVVALYKKSHPNAAKPAASASSAAMPVAATPASAPASAASAAAAAKPGAPATPTPAVAVAPTPCSDPGPFAYTAPEQKPLETSGAHSPAATAASPPSVRPESAQMAPAPAKK